MLDGPYAHPGRTDGVPEPYQTIVVVDGDGTTHQVLDGPGDTVHHGGERVGVPPAGGEVTCGPVTS